MVYAKGKMREVAETIYGQEKVFITQRKMNPQEMDTETNALVRKQGVRELAINL